MMDLLPYMRLFLQFLTDEYLNGLWIAGIGMACFISLFALLKRKRWM